MKLVRNTCYGGFGLSPAAIAEYLKRKGKDAYFYEKVSKRDSEQEDRFRKIDVENVKDAYSVRVVLRDLGQVTSGLSLDAVFHDYNIDRDDPDLIRIVESMGDDVNGPHASLEVINIPDGIEWEISNYDGVETICEKHRKW